MLSIAGPPLIAVDGAVPVYTRLEGTFVVLDADGGELLRDSPFLYTMFPGDKIELKFDLRAKVLTRVAGVALRDLNGNEVLRESFGPYIMPAGSSADVLWVIHAIEGGAPS